MMEADFIIIGGGTAGCVLAARLSEDPRTRVLLLEAGPRDLHPWIHIPAGFARMLGNPRFDWGYKSQPDLMSGDRALGMPRGKVLGGSGSVNGLGFTRGFASDFDGWAAAGASGWGYEAVLPYFLKMETFDGPVTTNRGRVGPLHVGYPADRSCVTDAARAGAAAIGIPPSTDLNVDPDGSGYFQLLVHRGRRVSTATAYLNPARRRPNLKIVASAEAKRIIFESRRAVGVLYDRCGHECEARCRAEVLLCAGAIGSPLLLEASGVGRAEHLKSLDIQVMKPLNGVGENLQDHYVVRSKWRVSHPYSYNRQARGWRVVSEALRYAAFRRGMLAAEGGTLLMFARSGLAPGLPDLELTLAPWSYPATPPFVPEAEPGVTFSAFQLRPESRGSVHLCGKGARFPAILPNYLRDPRDSKVLVDGIRQMRRLARTPVLAACLREEITPGPDTQTEEELLDYARNTGLSIYHLVGTCRMGTDEGTVVDPKLRVHGLSGLRVVDASVMPTIVSGHSFAATVMIAEKAADLIGKH